MRIPEVADRDFTASAYVVDGERVLLIRHAKLDRWLQPGGHIDERETPDEAALREVYEETGVRAEIHPDRVRESTPEGPSDLLPEPFRVSLHPITGEGDHWHVDFAYLATPVDADDGHDSAEHDGKRWFSVEDLEVLDDLDADTRRTATRAIAAVR